MKKLTAMALLALGVVFAANAQTNQDNSQVRIVKNLEDLRYSVVYNTEDKSSVRLRIFNPNGKMIQNERISGGSFWKAYDFKNQKAGIYKFQIITGDETISKEVAHKMDNTELAMDVDKLGDSKYQLSVSGVDHNPVTISVTDDNGKVVYHNIIDANSDFNQVFDLSNFKSDAFTITVEKDDQVITKSI